MLIHNVEVLSERDPETYFWSSLDRYLNSNFVFKKIISRAGLPKGQYKNVKKQSRQIRYSIQLAKEYYNASKNSSLHTKPVFLYYSCMWLAVAQFLYKGPGDVSIDKARTQHRHHGLIFSMDPSFHGENAQDALLKLNAAPISKNGNNIGTFELWRQYSRHLPICGMNFEIRSGVHQSGVRPLLYFNDSPPKKLKSSGTSLFDCWIRLPFLNSLLLDMGITTRFARADISRTASITDPFYWLRVMVHPCDDTVRDSILDSIKCDSDFVENIELFDVESGLGFRVRNWNGHRRYFNYPEGFNFKESFYIFSDELDYNEFGNIYISLFILSNLARYYPDYWIKEVDNSTDFSVACSYFLNVAAERIARLTFCELSEKIFVDKPRQIDP